MTNAVVQLTKSSEPAVVPVAPVAPMPPLEPVAQQMPVITVATTAPAAPHWQPPILGSLAVIFGVAALFTAFPGRLILAPLALAVALSAGLFRQTSWAVIGAAAAAVALVTSESFWALVGLAWLLNWLI